MYAQTRPEAWGVKPSIINDGIGFKWNRTIRND
jgi:hypothetical protein